MSNPTTDEVPTASPAQPQATADGSKEAGGEGVVEQTKSAAKKLAKQQALLAKKALKAVSKTENAAAKEGQEGGAKKAKAAPVKTKQEEEVEEPYVNITPKGQKKILSEKMAKGYDPRAVESAWYDWWLERGFFKPQFEADGSPKKAGTFVIPAPPPNVTGKLHIGHALAVALEDSLCRWNRMLGKTVLFNPGYDHAGISTQSVVEKRLYQSTGQNRHDLGREEFLKRVWQWKDEYQTNITKQAYRLGASYDWDRVAFTMDETRCRAVFETFTRLHDEGTIYRADRIVNWCVHLRTVLSNEEVATKEIPGRTLMNVPGYGDERVEVGVLTSIAYEIEGSDERLIIATTRPETLLGDTAIAVHPDDPRYKHLHGKRAKHPLQPRTIPIVTDDIAVDMEFGTGAVKITPAHDPNDYEVGKRHNLEFINVMNDDGTMNENAGEAYVGKKRYTVRRQIIKDLKDLGLYVGAQDNPMSIGVCDKSGDIIEPVIKPQWYVSVKPIAKEVLERTRAGEMTIRPASSEAEFVNWLENLQDWCISRQLWWGHRCPVYYVTFEGENPQDRSISERWVAGRMEAEAQEKATAKYPGQKFTISQDEDVLDTWFSSGLWPMSIHGWPEKTPDLARFFPAAILETGWDIIPFWVVRMCLFGVKLMGQMPFREVFCHPLIRDAEGRKMSKSLGNVIDPIDVAEGITLADLNKQLLVGNLDAKEIARAQADQKKMFGDGIPECGIDALRFTLASYTGYGRDINLDVKVVVGYRKFCNKLWNAIKFALDKFDDDFVPASSAAPSGSEGIADKWVLHQLNLAAKEVNTRLGERYFMHATRAIFDFWLKELCDVYIEAIKPATDASAPPATRRAAQDTLYTCLDLGLRMLHPFMPYLTEELWQRLPRRPNDPTESICIADFPVDNSAYHFAKEAAHFDYANQVVFEIRSIAATYGLSVKEPLVQAFVETPDEERRNVLTSVVPTLKTMIKGIKSIDVVADRSTVPAGCATKTIGVNVVHVLVKGLVDVDSEIRKLEARATALEFRKAGLFKQTQAEDYEKKVPLAIQTLNRDNLAKFDAELETIQRAIEDFNKLKA